MSNSRCSPVNPESATSPTVAERIVAALARHDAELIFGQSLPSALILAAEDIGIRQITYRTENAAGAMADGYARSSNKVGIVAAQNGPAAALLVAPLAEAYKASIPIIALVQEVNQGQEERNAFQSLDHIKLFESCTKWARCLTDGERAEDYIDMAFTAATTGRPGPVALMLPANLLIKTAARPLFTRTQNLGHWPLDRNTADRRQIDEAARLLTNAENPLLIAGGGAHASQACSVLADLQESAHLPVATTMMGKGAVDERHLLSAGLLGNAMGKNSTGRFTKPLLDNADVIMLIGNRTNQNGTDNWSLFPPQAKIIHLDVCGEEVGRTYESLRLVGDAKLSLEALKETILQLDLTKRKSKRSGIEQLISTAREKQWETTKELRCSISSPIRPERVMQEIQAALTPQTTVVADASYSSVWINCYLQASQAGQRFLTPRGLAGLGWGLPMAMGAQLASKGPVICVVGDGGFAHCWSELETAKRMNIAVVLIVLNNSVLGFQKDAETVKFGRYTSACHFNAVDHAAIANACGVAAQRVENPEEIYGYLRQAIESNEITLLDVITDPNAYPPLTMFDQ